MRASPHGGAPRVVRVPRTGSTNDDLAAAAEAAPRDWPHLSALVADHQEAGHGRAGRDWHTPAGQALTVSFLLRPAVPAGALPAVPVVAGLAVARAVGGLLPGGVTAATKWPNDVLLRPAGPAAEVEGWGPDRKVAGILARVVPAGPAHERPAGPAHERAAGPGAPAGDEADDARLARLGVVLGIGVNVAQGAADLPVPWATSLALAGAAASVDDVLGAVGAQLAAVLDAWEAAGGDLERAACPSGAGSLHDAVVAGCATVGAPVRVSLAGGRTLAGTAVGLDARGRLLLAPDGAGGVVTVESGDVCHLRTGARGPDAEV